MSWTVWALVSKVNLGRQNCSIFGWFIEESLKIVWKWSASFANHDCIFSHLMFWLELLQDPGIVLRLLEVGEGDAGDKVDLLHQRLALVVVLEVLCVELVVLGVGGDGVVVVGAVKVVAAVRVPGIALEQLLTFKTLSLPGTVRGSLNYT